MKNQKVLPLVTLCLLWPLLQARKLVGNEKLKDVNEFTYLGSKLTLDGRSKGDIKFRMAKKPYSGSNHRKQSSSPKPLGSKNENKTQNAFKISESDNLGRYLVASKNLNAGEIVLMDEPLAVGPIQEAKPLCLGCYTDIHLDDAASFQRCTYCKWPLCSNNCPGLHQSKGHSKDECELLSSSLIGEKEALDFANYYYAIFPFRCLILKEKNSVLWETLQVMEPHTEIRKKETKLWETNQKFAVDVIRDVWGLKQFSDEDIHFVCGILEVNAFEINPSNQGAQYLQALYPKAYLFAHNCVPNTNHSNTRDYSLVVRAIRKIQINEIISVSYTYTLQPTFKRRKHLRTTKFFSCTCKRCTDPTELGTYIGAIKCSICKHFVLPKNPLDEDSLWKCISPKCNFQIQECQILPTLDRLFKKLDSIEGNNVIAYEKFYKECCSIFHENHYLSLSALHCLSQLYGKIDGYLINDLTQELLERKVEICKKLIKVFEVLEPGHCKERGILLYELQAPLMVLLRRKHEIQKIPTKEMKSKIKEILKYLEESQLILSKQPEYSVEVSMAEAAREGISSLNQWLKLVK